jgi:hypothetical protein
MNPTNSTIENMLEDELIDYLIENTTNNKLNDINEQELQLCPIGELMERYTLPPTHITELCQSLFKEPNARPFYDEGYYIYEM